MTQLDLFDGVGAPVASPELRTTALRRLRRPFLVSKKVADRAGAALAFAGVPIPARCPVTGGRTCHRAACSYYRPEAGGLCAHPEAPTARRQRRSRKPAR